MGGCATKQIETNREADNAVHHYLMGIKLIEKMA